MSFYNSLSFSLQVRPPHRAGFQYVRAPQTCHCQMDQSQAGTQSALSVRALPTQTDGPTNRRTYTTTSRGTEWDTQTSPLLSWAAKSANVLLPLMGHKPGGPDVDTSLIPSGSTQNATCYIVVIAVQLVQNITHHVDQIPHTVQTVQRDVYSCRNLILIITNRNFHRKV